MEYKHFSHEHNLTLSIAEEGRHHQCHGCKTLCNPPSSMLACWKCNFFLHEHCGNANRFLKHPAHPEHPVILLPNPTYCSGAFNCNACGSSGNSFSYSCALCEIDLHVNCAFLPLDLTHKAHQHGLFLGVPADSQQIPKEFCKICNQELNPKLWIYYCREAECDFKVHTRCATTEVKPGQYVDDGPEASDQTGRSTPSQPEVQTNQTQTEFTQEQNNQLHQMRLQMHMDQMSRIMSSIDLMGQIGC